MKMKSVIFLATFLLVALGVISPAYAEATETIETVSVSNYHDQAEVEKKVREYFADVPDMIEIARCESNFRQYTDSGSVLRGGAAGQMIGVFQFNEPIHLSTAKNLGFDIYTLEGNLAYAKYVYELQGTTPWVSCLKNPTAPTVAATVGVSNQNVSEPTIAELQAKIKQLKQILELLLQLQQLMKLQAVS